MKFEIIPNSFGFANVIPANAGIQNSLEPTKVVFLSIMDSRVRGNDIVI